MLGGASRSQAQQQHNAALEDAEVMYGGGDATAYAQRAHRASGNNSQAGKNVRGSSNAAAAAAPVHNVQLPSQYNKPAGPQQQYHALQQHQQQYNGYTNGYASGVHQQQQRMGGYPNPQHGQQGAAAAGAQCWAVQQQQAKQQQAAVNGMHGHYQQQQQQQNGCRAGPMAHGGAGQDMMNYMAHAQAGPAYNSNSSAGFNSAPAAGTPASLTQALAAMAAVLPAGFDYATAFEAFSKVMQPSEAAAFSQQFTAAMQQQQAQRQQH